MCICSVVVVCVCVCVCVSVYLYHGFVVYIVNYNLNYLNVPSTYEIIRLELTVHVMPFGSSFNLLHLIINRQFSTHLDLFAGDNATRSVIIGIR